MREGDEARVVLVGAQERTVQQLGHTGVVWEQFGVTDDVDEENMPCSLEKCIRKDFYKLDAVASRAILRGQSADRLSLSRARGRVKGLEMPGRLFMIFLDSPICSPLENN